MSMIIDGTNGLTFNNATTQASAGVVLQVIGATTTSSTSTSSTSFVTTSLTASITPKFSTSKILVLINGGMVTTNNSAQGIYTTIYRNSTNLASATWGMSEYYSASGGQLQAPTSISYLDSPTTTSSTSYTMYLRAGGAFTVYFNADAVTASITLLEIAA